MERREWKFGEDEFIFEPPDIIVSRGRGEIRADGLKDALPVFRELCEKAPLYMVLDLTFTKGMKLSLEKDHLKEIKITWFKGLVVVKSGTLMKLAVKGMYLATGYFGMASNILEFVDTLDEAYAILDADRAKKAAAARPDHGA